MRTILFGLVFLTLSSSCQDRRGINVTGKIVDDVTGNPIQDADVLVLCWYNYGMDDESFRKKAITTDRFGNFTTTFDKGHRIDIASQANGFLPSKRSVKLESNEINIELELNRDKRNEALISRIVKEDDFINASEKTPMLRLRTQNNKTVTYGFDFKHLMAQVDTLNCDLWFKIDKKPATIKVPKTGGIIPIFKGEIQSSLLYELEQAPLTGYGKSYTLTGEEVGLFIMCRDGKTFAKIIFYDGIVDISESGTESSLIKEQRKYFSYVYQPNGSNELIFPNAKIDLERFLVDFTYK